MVDVYMRQTGDDPDKRSVVDISNLIAKKWLEKQSSGKTCHISFSPARSPQSSLERQVPDKFTIPYSTESSDGDSSEEKRASPKIQTTHIKPIAGAGCLVSTTNAFENNSFNILLNDSSVNQE